MSHRLSIFLKRRKLLKNALAAPPAILEPSCRVYRRGLDLFRPVKYGMTVIIDIGDTNEIHPRNKLDVGHRLAAWTLANTYREKVQPSGPLYASFAVEGDKIRVKFKHVAGGLKTPEGGPLKGFAIAGPDQKFVWANARIDGTDVLVWSKDVTKPVAVRYAWADNPISNLYNAVDLPASPFRPDNWPGITVNRK